MASNQDPGPAEEEEEDDDEEEISEDSVKNNVNTFRDYLEKAIVVKDLVGHFELFSREQKQELLQAAKTNSAVAATRQALETIDQLSQPQKYTRLLEVLESADYPKLVGLLKGKLFPANDDHRRRFNELTSDFYQRLNPSEVLPYLIQKAVISSEEAAEIRNVQTYKSRSDAVLALLFILPNRQRFWYDWMIWSLVKSNQVELAEKIDPVLTKVMCNEGGVIPIYNRPVSLQSMRNRGASHERLTGTGVAVANVPHSSPKALLRGTQEPIQNESREIYCRDKESQLTQKSHSITTTTTGAGHNNDVKDTNDLKNQFENLPTKAVPNDWKTKEDCKNEIVFVCDELHMTIDKLKDTALDNLDNNSIYPLDQIKTLRNALDWLNKETQIHEQAKTHKLTENHTKSLINQKEYESVYKDTQKEDSMPNLAFQKNGKLDELLKEVRTFGSTEVVNVTENDTSRESIDTGSNAIQNQNSGSHLKRFKFISSLPSLSKSLLRKKTKSETDDNASHSQTQRYIIAEYGIYRAGWNTDDRRAPFHTGTTFMPCGKLVVCDRFNKRLTQFAKTFEMIDYIELPSGPHDVSVVDNDNVIVTLLMKHQLQYVQVFPKMTSGRVIQLENRCWGLEVFNSEIYVTIHYGYGYGEVTVLDLDGNMKRTINIHQDGLNLFLRCPFYLSINPVSKKLYVSDFGGPSGYPRVPSTLYCLTLDGDVVYSYQDSDWCWGGGVYVDDRDKVLVCGQYSNNIHVVTHDGAKDKVLLSAKDGITQPLCIAVRPSDSTLVVGCWGCENLSMFVLGKLRPESSDNSA